MTQRRKYQGTELTHKPPRGADVFGDMIPTRRHYCVIDQGLKVAAMEEGYKRRALLFRSAAIEGAHPGAAAWRPFTDIFAADVATPSSSLLEVRCPLCRTSSERGPLPAARTIHAPTHPSVAAIAVACRPSRSADIMRYGMRPASVNGRRSNAWAAIEVRPHRAQIARPGPTGRSTTCSRHTRRPLTPQSLQGPPGPTPVIQQARKCCWESLRTPCTHSGQRCRPTKMRARSSTRTSQRWPSCSPRSSAAPTVTRGRQQAPHKRATSAPDAAPGASEGPPGLTTQPRPPAQAAVPIADVHDPLRAWAAWAVWRAPVGLRWPSPIMSDPNCATRQAVRKKHTTHLYAARNGDGK